MAKLETNNYYCPRFNIIPQLPSIASVAYSASRSFGGLLGRFSAKSGRCGKEMLLFVCRPRVIAPPSIILDVWVKHPDAIRLANPAEQE